MKYIFAGLLIILNLRTANADILFLDLNNSPKEIEAAQKAAKQRGEKLIVFPEETKGAESHYNFPKILSEKLNELKLNDQQKKISSVIISGHNGNGNFAGTKGSISYSGLQNVLEAHPDLNDSVKSLYLWGCYTATPGSIINNWKPTFKNLDVIIGYDGVAPANDKLAGHNYLADALIKEKKMTNAKTDKELKNVFNSLANVKTVHASLCKGDTYVSNKKMASLQKMKEQCNETEAAKWADVYECYMYGRQPNPPDNQDLDCTDVPSSTANSKLREMYNYLQDTGHCDDLIRSNRGRNRDQVIRLIFYKNVLKNYFENNKSCVDAVNKTLSDEGSSRKIDMQSWPKLKRSEILKLTSEINEEIYGYRNSDSNLADQNITDLSIKTIERKINQNVASHCVAQISEINNASDYVIPFSWVEESSQEKSRLMEVSVIKVMTEGSLIDSKAREYLFSKIKESNAADIVEEEDIKKLIELEKQKYRVDENMTVEIRKTAQENYNIYQSELKNKYKDKITEIKNKIKNNLQGDIDPRIKSNLGRRLSEDSFDTIINIAQQRYRIKSLAAKNSQNDDSTIVRPSSTSR